ncbi:LytTR family DNA-binding domain-containing protein [Algoriphagus confluentis]|uniref:LytTR family DNA-binding domain-containing protein n=1 Tax=Algoriphagus confluentis TaxID=1697556 RepID=A0ABQ6PQL7_9BACT|nr:LytTR family DNA-binding domain-containing protein [Algoriphagus confluentis]
MKVLIIEDEAPAFRRLQKILEEIDPEIQILEVIDSVDETVKWLKYHQEPDLIFMDIQLSDGISFEIFDQLKIQSPVIFTTAFDEFMLKAFKVNSIDYLLKPIKKEELQQSLEKFQNWFQLGRKSSSQPDFQKVLEEIRADQKNYKSRWLIRQGEKFSSIPTEDIAYFYTSNGVVHLTTQNGKNYLMESNLETIQQDLDPSKFYRANRQFLVHFSAIQQVERYHKGKLFVQLNPPSKEAVIISSEKASEFKNWLDQ